MGSLYDTLDMQRDIYVSFNLNAESFRIGILKGALVRSQSKLLDVSDIHRLDRYPSYVRSSEIYSRSPASPHFT